MIKRAQLCRLPRRNFAKAELADPYVVIFARRNGREPCRGANELMVPGSSTTLRILIATSDLRVGRALADRVRRAGHHPILAADGPMVLEWFQREVDHPHSIDLAVLDAALPGYPGVALAACARNNAIGLPLILMQDSQLRIGAEWLARLGLLGILCSPVDADEFGRLLDGFTRPRTARGTTPPFPRS